MDVALVQAKLDYIAREVAAAQQQAVAWHALTDEADPAGVLRGGLLRGIRYCLQTAVRAMIDVAYHIAAKDFRLAPRDAYQAFEALVRGGVLPAQRLTPYRRLIGFGNVIVPGYTEVDDARVLALVDAREDFDAFREEILAYARRHPEHRASARGG
jgi:uncharacterized protein YutE (UPF0331/DUF86 family)